MRRPLHAVLLCLVASLLPGLAHCEGSCRKGVRHNTSWFMRPDRILPVPHLMYTGPLTPDKHWYRGIQCTPKSEYPRPPGDCGPSECAFPGFGCYLGSNCTVWRTGAFDWSHELTYYTDEEAALKPMQESIDQNGTFFDDKWVPQSGGPVKWFSPRQAAHCLRGKRVTFSGDSMMRQLFMRFIFFLRGFTQFAEPHHQRSANYHYNGTHDVLFYHGENLPPRPRAKKRLPMAVPHAFEFEFVWSHLEFASLKSVQQSQPDVLITALMYHDRSGVLLNYTGPYLRRVVQETDVRHVLLLAVPPYAWENATHFIPMYQARNANMRQGVSEYLASRVASAPRADKVPPMTAVVVPLDHMAATSPWATNENEIHYMCRMKSRDHDTMVWYTYRSPRNRDCRDLFNLNAVQLILNHICRHG